MIIREAFHQEVLYIKQHSSIVKQEATMGYLGSSPGPSPDLFLNNSSYFVMIDHNRLVGWVQLGEAMDYNKNEKIGFISELYVLPGFRKHGYGQALMKKALHQLKQRGLNYVQLNVFSGNNAKSIYERLGFSDVSTLMEKKL